MGIAEIVIVSGEVLHPDAFTNLTVLVQVFDAIGVIPVLKYALYFTVNIAPSSAKFVEYQEVYPIELT